MEGKDKEGGERRRALRRLPLFTPSILNNSTSVKRKSNYTPVGLDGNTGRDHSVSFTVFPSGLIRPSAITDHSQARTSRGECP